MAKVRFAARISQAVFTGIIMFALLFIIFTGIISAVNGMAGTNGPVFPSPWLELLMGFVGFAIPISIEIGRYNEAEAETKS
jgi:hypothetical protein